MKYTVGIDGMACGMCEAHICNVIRTTVKDAKKVKASHRKAIATFVVDSPIDEAALKAAIDATGYRFLSIENDG